MRLRALSVALLAALAAWPAAARDAFEGTFTVDGQTTQVSRRSAEDFVDIFTDAGLRSLFATYTAQSAATAVVNLRGLPATLTYAQGSTTLRLIVPTAGVDERFTGATRDESQDLALKWFQGRGGSALTSVLRAAVANTSIDPVAGNPNSLMSQMGTSDFAAGVGGAGGAGSRFSLGARFGSYSAEGFDTRVWTLPLGYTYGLANGSTLILDAPLTLMSSGGAQSYSGSLGIGWRVPVALATPALAWTLTPMLRVGGVGSVALGAVGGIWSVSLTSSLEWRPREGTQITVGNMISRLQTFPISIGSYNVSYDLTNFMFRNGVIGTQAVGEWFGRPVRASAFLIDTRFTGDALFVRSYQEFGGFVSFDLRAAGQAVPLSLGVTILSGERGYRGYSLNLGMSF